LDLDFFEGSVALAKSRPAVRTALRRFKQALEAATGFGNPWRPTPASLEQFFADVYYDVATNRTAQSFEVFVSLLDLYAQVLEETTNWMAERRPASLVERSEQKSGGVTAMNSPSLPSITT